MFKVEREEYYSCASALPRANLPAPYYTCSVSWLRTPEQWFLEERLSIDKSFNSQAMYSLQFTTIALEILRDKSVRDLVDLPG